MAGLTSRVLLLAATLTCGLAYVPKSNLKCECTCSPTNNPAAKYSAVGNFEAVIKPKADPWTSTRTSLKPTTEIVLESKVPTVPTILQDSPFKVNTKPNLGVFNYKEGNTKESTVYEIRKETSAPLVQQRFSSKPVNYTSRSTTYSSMSPTSAPIVQNAPIELKESQPSAFRKTIKTVSNNSTSPKDSETPMELIDTKRIEELSKTEALTLDDIIFGKVPFEFGSRGIQRNFLTDSETKALKEERAAQTADTTSSITTKRSVTGTAIPETIATAEFKATETIVSETPNPVKKSTMNRVQSETPAEATQISTSTILTTTSAPTTPSTITTATTTTTTTEAPTTTPVTTPVTQKTPKPNGRRGLLPLFRTAFSPMAAAKTEKPSVVTSAATPSTEPSTEAASKTTTSTTQKVTTPTETTPRPTTKAPTTTTTTTQKPTTKRKQETQTQLSYNVNPSSPSSKSSTTQRKVPLIAKEVNPSYTFSDSFRKNTIRNLLDAFKPEYMKALHEEVTFNPQQKQSEARQQYHFAAPPQTNSVMQQKVGDIPFGHFEKTRTVDVPNHQLVHSMSSLSSMSSSQSGNSRQPALVVVDSPAQEQRVSYQLHNQQQHVQQQQLTQQQHVQQQQQQQEPVWNPIQEPKKWGEPKSWGNENHQQFQQSMNLQNHQLWNPQHNSLQGSQMYNPSFSLRPQTQQKTQQQQGQSAFPGLQLNKSPIDFRVH